MSRQIRTRGYDCSGDTYFSVILLDPLIKVLCCSRRQGRLSTGMMATPFCYRLIRFSSLQPVDNLRALSNLRQRGYDVFYVLPNAPFLSVTCEFRASSDLLRFWHEVHKRSDRRYCDSHTVCKQVFGHHTIWSVNFPYQRTWSLYASVKGS